MVDLPRRWGEAQVAHCNADLSLHVGVGGCISSLLPRSNFVLVGDDGIDDSY
jgi:hypothetical protein